MQDKVSGLQGRAEQVRMPLRLDYNTQRSKLGEDTDIQNPKEQDSNVLVIQQRRSGDLDRLSC